MSIVDQINRLNNAKAAIKQSLANKGVEVSDSALLDEYPALIDSIEVGGSSDSESVWNLFTNNGTRGAHLFRDCKELTELDVSHLDTSNMTNMSYMFGNCIHLTSLDVSNFNTSNVTDMNHMFYICQILTELNLSNFDTSKVTDMSYMFYGCTGLIELDVNHFDISKVTTISSMFYKCENLTTLDVSNWDLSKITSNYYIADAFDYCISLVDFYPPKNISGAMSVKNSTVLSHDSLMRIINNLITATSTKTLTLGATNLAKLTEDEIAIATNKGWTVK